MIKPLHLDRLPVFKNLFHNIKVVPPTGTQKTNIKTQQDLSNHTNNKLNSKKENLNHLTEMSEKKLLKSGETLDIDFLQELKEKHDVHYEKINIFKREDGKLNWHCPEENCSRTFVKRSQLKLHIFSHKNVKPFKCSHEGCNWSFPTVVRLKRHEISHQGLKLFKCNLPGEFIMWAKGWLNQIYPFFINKKNG